MPENLRENPTARLTIRKIVTENQILAASLFRSLNGIFISYEGFVTEKNPDIRKARNKSVNRKLAAISLNKNIKILLGMLCEQELIEDDEFTIQLVISLWHLLREENSRLIANRSSGPRPSPASSLSPSTD